MIDAKSYLLQVRRLDLQIKNKLVERQQWKDMALGITSNIGGERVQSSGGKNKIESAVIKCVDMENEINVLVDSLIEAKKSVIATIEKLESPTEYDILHKRYIQFMSLQEIADQCRREYTTITTAHGRALKNVEKLLERG